MVNIGTLNTISNLYTYFKAVAQGKNKLRYLPDFYYNRELTDPSNKTELLNAYKSWVYVCASRNAQVASSYAIKLYVAKPSRTKSLVETKSLTKNEKKHLYSIPSLDRILSKAVEIEEVLEHPFLDLMKTVNPFVDESELKEITWLHQELAGNAYWYLVKNNLNLPVQIWTMQPDKTKVVPSKEEFIKGYVYKQGFDEVFFENSEIVHFKYPSPTSVYYGMSPLQAVTYAYDINMNMNKYETGIFSNMGRPEGTLETDQILGEDEFDRLKAQWTQKYGGTGNAGKTAILEKGVKYHAIALSPREMSFLTGRKLTKEEIFNAYGIPLGLFSEESNRANSEMANFNYMSGTISPKHRRVEGKLNEFVLPLYDERLFCAFEDCIPSNETLDHKRRIDNVNAGIITRNEARMEEGMEDLEGLDDIYIPNNLVPIGMMTDQEIEEVSREISKKVKERFVKT